MASKKSAKRSAKKRPAAKGSRSKKPAGKAKAGGRKAKAAGSKRRRKASRPAIGLGTVRQVGEKTWQTLKSTTAQVVEGVKDTFGG